MSILTVITPTIGRKVITPTIGRKVWFWRPENQSEVPEDATVCFVWPQTEEEVQLGVFRLNLRVTDHNGDCFAKHHVPLVPSALDRNVLRPWAQWMPYQTQQAAKQEAEKTKTTAQPTLMVDLSRRTP